MGTSLKYNRPVADVVVEKFGKKMANPNSYGARKRNNLHTKGNI